ncbi:hypothetical protein HG536_0B00840 [Torulaspora globosa]|uniref:PH domain-containing protein n=1 Tax=Torulaspora globosa TaxID=48254 RepID=A0A7G3ZCI7_9SACH|nr:uncharacterized protein HG536_0B00840 [Torulaspora globosa]QLL31223.1 hypothetical protein HG536_0B00840 [Torulaspora globosa]
MKRIFSGAMSPDFPAPPKFFQRDASASDPTSPKSLRSRSSSISKILGGDSSPKVPPVLPQEMSVTGSVSPELIPIVTLLSAHAHRRYHEGVFLILQDLKGDGTAAARKWQEVYGVLIGTQLALWDAKELAECESGNNNPRLKDVARKPQYINFTDATLRPLDGSDVIVTESKKSLQNALVVSTTLKNRYFLQFSDKESFNRWHAAIRLSLFEETALQEAYTGAFLSSRGAKLGDIKIILSDSKFDYEDWVSVRFGAGMPWKRCFAVISQSTSKKHPFGKISFYESDKKTKKTNVMATVTSSVALYAVYPSSPLLIDTSTIIKLEGSIVFNKKEEPQDSSIFIMPEKHHAVPGYDTIIRFLVPAMNAFKLYGRPKKLIANKDDQNSLLFALPTLPHVHYLKADELLPLTNSVSSLQWTAHEWRDHIRDILQKKLSHGYTGCGSSSGLTGALASPVIASAELFDGTGGAASSSFLSLQKPLQGSSISSRSESVSTFTSKSASPRKSKHLPTPSNLNKGSSDSVSATSSSSVKATDKSLTSQSSELNISQDNNVIPQLKVDIPDSNFSRLGGDHAMKNRTNPVEKFSHASDLSAIYDKYSVSPFGESLTESPVAQTINIEDRSPYEQYVGSTGGRTLEISNIRDSNSTAGTDARNSSGNYHLGKREGLEETKDSEELSNFARRVSEMKIENDMPLRKPAAEATISPIDIDLNFNVPHHHSPGNEGSEDDNVFDPDFMEQNQMLESESIYTSADGKAGEFEAYRNDRNEPYEPKPNQAAQPTQAPAIDLQQTDHRLPHSGPVRNFQQYRGPSASPDPSNGYKNNHRQAPPQQTDINRQNLYQRQAYPDSPHRALVQRGNSPQYSNFPNPGLKNSSSRPLPPQISNKASPQMQSHPRPYVPMHPQSSQQYPTHGGQYSKSQNGPPPQNMNRMGASAPMNPNGGRVGPYLQQAGPVSHHKPRPAPNGGFSQFMPSTSTNPYAR